MQEKHLNLLDKMEYFLEQFEKKKAGSSSILDKFGRQIENLEKEIAILKSEAHPPVFTKEQYKDLLKRIKKVENGQKGTKNS